VQTVLPVEDVEKLKKTTSEVSTKEALEHNKCLTLFLKV